MLPKPPCPQRQIFLWVKTRFLQPMCWCLFFSWVSSVGKSCCETAVNGQARAGGECSFRTGEIGDHAGDLVEFAFMIFLLLLVGAVRSKASGQIRGLPVGGDQRFFLRGGACKCRLHENFPDVGEPDEAEDLFQIRALLVVG